MRMTLPRTTSAFSFLLVGLLTLNLMAMPLQNQVSNQIDDISYLLMKSGQVIRGTIKVDGSKTTVHYDNGDYIQLDTRKVERSFPSMKNLSNYKSAITPLNRIAQTELIDWLLVNKQFDIARNQLLDAQNAKVPLDYERLTSQIDIAENPGKSKNSGIAIQASYRSIADSASSDKKETYTRESSTRETSGPQTQQSTNQSSRKANRSQRRTINDRVAPSKVVNRQSLAGGPAGDSPEPKIPQAPIPAAPSTRPIVEDAMVVSFRTSFTEKVQGHLVFGCGLSGCHTNDSGREFILDYHFGRPLTAEQNRRNFEFVWNYAKKNSKKLLQHVEQPHSNLKRGIYSKSSLEYRSIATWVNGVRIHHERTPQGRSEIVSRNTAPQIQQKIAKAPELPQSVAKINTDSVSEKPATGPRSVPNLNAKSTRSNRNRLQEKNSFPGSLPRNTNQVGGIGNTKTSSAETFAIRPDQQGEFVPVDEFDAEIFNRKMAERETPKVESETKSESIPSSAPGRLTGGEYNTRSPFK